eukprot:SAG22_NODE_1010_length_6043_cov_2.870962_5_plen_216_part_00
MDGFADAGEIDLDEVWGRMGTKLEYLLTAFSEGELASRRTVIEGPEWMRMYTDVYDICVNHDQELVSELYELFRNLIYDHLKDQCTTILPQQGEQLARSYFERFRSVVHAAKYLRRIAEYMHRFWIPHQMYDADEEDIYELNVLVLVGWKEAVLRHTDKVLLQVLLDLIDNGREGNHADWDVVAGVIQSYVHVGQVDSLDPLKIYTEQFEVRRLG